MESDGYVGNISFGNKSGVYVTKKTLFFLGVLFVSAVVATGLLVYYYAPHQTGSASSSELDATTTTASLGVTPTHAGVTTTSPKGGSEETSQKEDVRLPRSLSPIHYNVKLRPFLFGDYRIEGYVEVEFEVIESTSNVTLHMVDIITKNDTIKLVRANDEGGAPLKIAKHKYDKSRQFYVASLQEALKEGQRYLLSMEFQGLLNDNLYGFYRSFYKDEDGNKRILASTQFQPTDARRAFPCFDEPALKAEFTITLGRQEGMSSLSNMPLLETKPIPGEAGWYWDIYKRSVPVSTYLVAFVISDFDHRNSTENKNALFRVWARSGAIDQVEYARSIGPKSLTFFEEYFNVPFPLPKQDMIAIPDFAAGAMENWGLITYRETAMLFDPLVSAAYNKQRVAIVVVHELAHQWFGNLVTPSWWTDLWLNEGFASFMQYIGTDHVEPSFKMMEQIVVGEQQESFALDSLESSHPVSVPVGHPDEINEIFDKISYSKGASIIRMMNFFLSEATFRTGLTNYLTKYKYRSAQQDDLWEQLTRQAHLDKTLPPSLTVKTIMDTWTLQMGYPVVTVVRNADGSAKLTQERYLIRTDPNSTDTHEYRWWIPINIVNQSEPDFSVTTPSLWMKDTEKEKIIYQLPTLNQWIILNIQSTGFYKINYDKANWNLIIKQLNTDHTVIHVINRAQLIDDALDLARAGLLSYDIALQTLSYLKNEKEYIPWKSATDNLEYLDQMLVRTGAYGGFKKFFMSLISHLYENVGFSEQKDDPHLLQYQRLTATSWTCHLGHEDCVRNAVLLYSKWMDNPTNLSLISPNQKSAVYCTAIAEGGEAEWKFGWEQYLNSNVGSEKATLLSALGCTKEIWILKRYMDWGFTDAHGIKKQDSSRVFRSVALNVVGRDLAWNYLVNNWNKIRAYYKSGLFAYGHLIRSVTSKINTRIELKELLQFQAEHASDLGSAARVLDQAIEKSTNNVAWMEAHYSDIFKWLETKGFSTPMRTV